MKTTRVVLAFLSFVQFRSSLGSCFSSLPVGETFSFKGNKVFTLDKKGNTLTTNLELNAAVIPVKGTLALRGSLTVQSKPPSSQSFSESFSVDTAYYIDPKTCVINFWQPGLESITVTRVEKASGKTSKIQYLGGAYLQYLAKMVGQKSSLVSKEKFGRYSPGTNQIILSDGMTLQSGSRNVPPPVTWKVRSGDASRGLMGKSAAGGTGCPTTLTTGFVYRFVQTKDGVYIQIDLVVHKGSLELHTKKSLVDNGFKHTHSMTVRDLTYMISPDTCMIKVTNTNFDSVDVSRYVRGQGVSFPPVPVKYPGRHYLNHLLGTFGGSGLEPSRVLGEVRGENVIRLDQKVDLKKM